MAQAAGSSAIRQNYTSEVEAAVNKQINIELYASYVYLSMSYYFDRDDVAFPNTAKWLKHQSDEEREHAQLLMKYQNTRGGRIVLQNIQKPERDDWGSLLEAFQAALALEKFNNSSLLELHNLAGQANDCQLCGEFFSALSSKFPINLIIISWKTNSCVNKLKASNKLVKLSQLSKLLAKDLENSLLTKNTSIKSKIAADILHFWYYF
uniref:Ferritin n=1 Tax=Panagrolaimus sp. JU765 TaxID=591449 RepID=A0AC34RL57_9BILA